MRARLAALGAWLADAVESLVGAVVDFLDEWDW